MARLTGAPVVVRAPRPSDGRLLADLWRVLWDAHEAWGSYAGSRDLAVYAEVARRLSEDAHIRGGHPLLGRHMHLVASLEGKVVGQVEGWIDRHGIDPKTPVTCEVRSLVVAEEARRSGAGRALLETLANVALDASGGAPTVLAAEVLENNPARAFYARLGFHTAAHCARMPVARALDVGGSVDFVARIAVPEDALPLALLESALAERRRAMGDLRFDRPRSLDAVQVDAIALHVGRWPRAPHEAAELVVVDRRNVPRGSATLSTAALEQPFLPGIRALLARFALDRAYPPSLLVPPLVRLAGRLSRLVGAAQLELVDLPAPASAIHEAILEAGASPWSRVVEKMVV